MQTFTNFMFRVHLFYTVSIQTNTKVLTLFNTKVLTLLQLSHIPKTVEFNKGVFLDPPSIILSSESFGCKISQAILFNPFPKSVI